MNTIVVAAIALVVLIVMIVIFSSRLGIFNRGVSSCEDKGGRGIIGTNADCIRQGGTPIGPYYVEETSEKEDGKVCCVLKE